MRVLDLFSGIGGFSLGLERAGMTTVAFCEIDPYCQKVLAKYWPGVPIYDDVRTFDPREGCAEIITGGFPCQDVSFAGKRAGVAGERSGLYREMVRTICVVRPVHAILENVAALLNNGMGRVLGELAENGYDAEWDCISASDVGAPHGRDRVWITATDANKLKFAHRSHKNSGRRLRCAKEAQEISNTDSLRELEPPRFLGYIRRRLNNATCGGAWWASDWTKEFAALRGMDDGVPTRLDRSDVANGVKALGNAVVPQIPEMIGRAIMAAANRK